MSFHGMFLDSSYPDSFEIDSTDLKLEGVMTTRRSCSRSRKMRKPYRPGQGDCSNKQLYVLMRTMFIPSRALQCMYGNLQNITDVVLSRNVDPSAAQNMSSFNEIRLCNAV